MKREIKFFAAAALLCFCASTLTFAKKNDNKPKYEQTGLEMHIGEAESSLIEMKHFAPAEIAQWTVLVIDSNNTQRTIDYLNASAEIMLKYKNAYAAEDCDWKQIKMLQDVRLKKIFKDVKYEAEEGKKYDLTIIRDFTVDLGPKAGAPTTASLSYWFVYPITSDMLVTGNLQYLYRGVYKSTKREIMQSGFSFELQNTNKKCIEELNYLLEGGLDILTLKK